MKKKKEDNEEHSTRKPARLCDISDRSLPRRPVAMSEKSPERLRLQNAQQLWILIIRARAADTNAKRAEVTTTRSEVNLSMHKSTGTIYHNKDREKVLEGHLCLFPCINWHREHILCGLILLNANLKDRITPQGKPYTAGMKRLKTGQLTCFPNACPIRQFKIIDRLHFQDFVACSIFWAYPRGKPTIFFRQLPITQFCCHRPAEGSY